MLAKRWALLLTLFGSCATDEYGFPHFRRRTDSSAFKPQTVEAQLTEAARSRLRCSDVRVAMEPTARGTRYVARGCGGAWLVKTCSNELAFVPLSGQPDERCHDEPTWTR